MSNEFIQAADDARRLLQGFAAVKVVADAFEKVGVLQQAEDEARNALTVHQAAIADAEAKEKDLQSQIGVLEAETQVERDKAKRVLADAQALADFVLLEAQTHAEQLVAATQVQIDSQIDTAQTALAGFKAQRDALADEVSALQTKLDTLKAQATALLG